MLRFSCVNPLEVLLRVLHAPTLTTTVKSYFARGGENNKFGSHDELVGAITNESDLAILFCQEVVTPPGIRIPHEWVGVGYGLFCSWECAKVINQM